MKADVASLMVDGRFWAAHLCSSFGQIGPPFEPEAVFELLGVSEEAVDSWWNTFTGWYEGVFDEADGWVDDPGVIEAPLAGGVSLTVEFHPGQTRYLVTAADSIEGQLLGEISGHWRLPMLRWSEAARLPHVTADSGWAAESPAALLLFLPGLWAEPTEEEALCIACVADAFRRVGLAREAAGKLARTWWLAVVAGAEYPWSVDAQCGWNTAATWSTRHVAPGRAAQVRRLNELLTRGGLQGGPGTP